MKDLTGILNQPVVVLTCDGRCIAGIMHSFDSSMNVCLKKSHERVYGRSEPGVGVVQLGPQVIRGDNVALIGKIDPKLEAQVNFESILADPFPEIYH